MVIVIEKLLACLTIITTLFATRALNNTCVDKSITNRSVITYERCGTKCRVINNAVMLIVNSRRHASLSVRLVPIANMN